MTAGPVLTDGHHHGVGGGSGRRPGLPRVGALDGLRGVAVAAVVVYHLDNTWLPGGFLGVSLFFTLSGFLITSLVLVEDQANGRLDRRAFWGRRFRRLLPAAWAGLAVAVLFAAVAGDADQLRRLPGDVIAALADVANWRFILAGDTYAAGYQAPSPVLHYWSLAIEEQFYVVFPLLVGWLVVRRVPRRVWVALFGTLTLISVALLAVLYDPDDSSRAYFGTFTRMGELLAGVLLALALHGWWHRPERPTPLGRGAVTALAAVAVVVTGVAWWVAHPDSAALYRSGGFPLVALASVGLIVAAVHPGNPLRWALGFRPLVALGAISYGVYVYHWPLFLWLSPERTGLATAPLTVVRLAVTLAVALLSFRFLEQPIRRGQVHLTAVTGGLAVGAAVLIAGASLWVGSRANARAVEDVQAAQGDRTIVTRPPEAGVTTAPGSAGTVPVAPPKRVLLLGDSLLHQAYPTIQARFADQGIETQAIGGPGQNLLRHNGDAWRAELEQAVRDFDPDVVVLESCCGHSDPKDPVTVNGKPLDDAGDDIWSVWRQAASQAVDIAGSRGAEVLWVLGPPAQTNGYYGPIEQRIGRANDVALGLRGDHPGLEYVDWRVLAAPDGSYTKTLPDADGKPVEVRAFDGLHFTPAGQGILADVTLQQVLAAWQQAGGRRATGPPGVPGTGLGVPGSRPPAGTAPAAPATAGGPAR